MSNAGTDFMIAAGTTIGLDGTGRGNRTNFVVVAVRSDFDSSR
jgi:hypothetical protein